MLLKDRIEALANLGEYLKKNTDEFKAIKVLASVKNSWFTPKNIQQSIDAIIENFLDANKLQEWTSKYKINDKQSKTLALVLAGNIPAVGFHDILCSFVANFTTQIKLSSKDDVLIPYFIKKLKEIDERTTGYFMIVERLKNFDAVIATGSNNTSLYFKQYFSPYPHIIRQNRHAIAIIYPDFNIEEIKAIGHDIYDYFGLGCRNVSKLLIHEDVQIKELMEIWHNQFNDITQHSKYMNNYDYNYAIYLLNKDQFLMNGGLILKQDSGIHSRIATVHYETWSDKQQLENIINEHGDDIQCVISKHQLANINTINPGQGQNPNLSDYADGIDVLHFLTTEV